MKRISLWKRTSLTGSISISKEFTFFTIIPILLFTIDNKEKESSIAVHWVIFGMNLVIQHKRKLYVRSKRPFDEQISVHKDYEIVKTNRLTYMVIDNFGKTIEKSKTLFYAPFEK